MDEPWLVSDTDCSVDCNPAAVVSLSSVLCCEIVVAVFPDVLGDSVVLITAVAVAVATVEFACS